MNTLTTFAFTLFIGFIFCSNIRDLEKQIWKQILDNYDPQFLPNGINGTGPTIVKHNFYIRRIGEINNKKMEMDVQLTYRNQWLDSRLKYDDHLGQIRYVSTRDYNKLWIPDTFVSNEINGHFHDMLTPNVLLRVFPNGEVLLSMRISLTLSCPMVFRTFPNHRVTCMIKTASYAYTTEDLVFLWKEGDPIQVTSYLHLPQYILTNFNTEYCTSRTNTGEYSCLKANFEFQSSSTKYWNEIYTPCAVLLLLSYTTLWVKRQHSNIRILVSLASFTLLYANIYVKESIVPSVTYWTSHDYWALFAILLSLFAVVESLVVFSIEKQSQHSNSENMDKNSVNHHIESEYLRKLVNIVDIAWRILFIVIFLIIFVFNF